MRYVLTRRHRFLWSAGLTAAGAATAAVALILTISLSGRVANQLEELQLENSMSRIKSTLQAFDQNLQHLADYTLGYALWDETYNYLANRDPAYITANYEESMLAISPAQLVAIYDQDRQLVFSRALDNQGKICPVPPGLKSRALTATFNGLEAGKYGGRLQWFGDQLYLLAICPISNSLGTAPINGYFIFGSVVGPKMLEKVSQLTDVKVSVSPIKKPSFGILYSSPVLGLATITIEPVQENGPSLARALFAPEGTPGVEFTMELPMKVGNMGRSLSVTIRSGFILVSLAFVLFAFLSLLEMRRRQREIQERIAEGEELRCALERAESLQEKAEAADRAKSAFLATMSHEIRTPLNAIVGYADLLKGIDAGPDGNQGIRAIRDSGLVLLRVINDILDFSKAEAGKLAIQPEPFDIRQVIEEVIALFKSPASDKGNYLTSDIDPALPRLVVADHGRIRQILYNLVSNSVKFTTRGEISLTVSRLPRTTPAAIDSQVSERYFLTITVRDEGVGISPEEEKFLFEPFSQADSTSTRRFEGSGLGLAISRRLCRLMDGDIFYHRPDTAGSIFEARIASGTALESNLKIAADPMPLKRSSGSLSVLIVDDNATNARLFQAILRRLGVEPRIASSGRQAIDIYKESPPNLILMDIQMPDMDGLETTRRIRDIETTSGYDRCRIVAVTADVLTVNRASAREAGMDDYLGKPIRPDQIEAVLQSLHAPVEG